MPCEGHRRSTRIWILRHGRSTLSQAQCYQGCSAESVLTEDGIRSARLAGNRLLQEGIDAIYSSPLPRAIQTAALVREALAAQGQYPACKIDIALREVELPGWEGLPYEAVTEKFADSYRQFRFAPASFSLPGPDGKTTWPLLEMERRVRGLFPSLLSQHKGRSVLLVTHGGPARVMLLSALGLDAAHFHSVQQSHGGISCIAADNASGLMRLEVLNETNHTGETLPKLKDGKTGLRVLLLAGDFTRTGDADRTEALAQLLENLPIHRAFADGPEGVMNAMRVLRYKSRVTIETCADSGLQGAVESQLRRQRPGELANLLVAGRVEALSTLAARCMQSSDANLPISLPLRPGLSVIHLPGAPKHPVLQAFNTYRAGWIPAGDIA